MKSRRFEVAVVYATGLVQGLALVAPPAASNIFTSAEFHGLSSGEYGSLFLPLVVAAIVTSSLGGPLAQRWRLKPVLVLGLGLNLVAASVLAASAAVVGNHSVAYATLLAAMAALGGGFGFTLTALNTYGAGFFPARSDTALTALHALLGTGTALAPLIVAGLTRTGAWWLFPVALTAGFAGLGLLGMALPLEVAAKRSASPEASRPLLKRIPPRLWLFGAVAILYGISETVFGNWAVIYLRDDAGLSAEWAGLGLAAFWAMVTVGRLVIAAASVWVSARCMYQTLPALLLLALLGVQQVHGPVGNLVAFGFAGLACSAFLPLSISFAGRQFPAEVEIIGGGMMAAYMVGYGIASFGVGALRQVADVPLSAIHRCESSRDRLVRSRLVARATQTTRPSPLAPNTLE